MKPARTARKWPTGSPGQGTRSESPPKPRVSNGNSRKPYSQLETLEQELKALQRQSRETTAKADDIEAAAYDLKAVNANRKSEEDTRTPAELLDFIACQRLRSRRGP